jgi:hypothetical protein
VLAVAALKKKDGKKERTAGADFKPAEHPAEPEHRE